MKPVLLSGACAAVEDVVAVARQGARVEIAPSVMKKLEQARQVLDRVAASGQKIYGLNTGLGANLGTEISDDASAFQRQLVGGRGGSVGAPLPMEIVRSAMFARAATLAVGGSGISPQVFAALLAALNASVHPVMPSLGSIGASDLLVMTPMARLLIGDGEAEFSGEQLPAGEALRRAGLKPVGLAPKDGLSLISSSAVSIGHGALVVADALEVFAQQQQAGALTIEGIGANRNSLDPRSQHARPAFGQEKAAEGLRVLLAGDGTESKTLQAPLSIRCMASVHGALLHAIGEARKTVETELNAAADNPLVLAEDGVVLSTGNFHTAALALAFEGLGLAIAQAATASASRFVQLTGSGRNGLPKYLSPVGGVSAGFVPLQKAISAILAAIRHKANPVVLDFLPVSEGVEDHATQTPLAIAKCADMVALWRRLVAFELMAAAQAVDLRQDIRLAPGTAAVHAQVRSLIRPLAEDRPLGEDADRLYVALSNGKWQA